ncbi:SAM-dependent methyltransferase [Pseudoduganella namucuonensis]|uniref:23S rRNA (Cytosine1962-C5)-methyltransferase n=1 Tax=Pseudoduganella namucuonensis TaxID=1035707 RepID=A0A1I7J748_9BURK|nr:SAM-dependent methyltransferase [Pseudoduganella namucuonensis]SFU81015.1 23S rRNA (cytosine1962-C5)-methyltransferase [Pseudoduganella namucuonensis]
MLIITIKQGKEKSILAGDPWIYPTAIERVDGRPQEKNKPGATAIVQSSSRQFLARAAFNAHATQIRARVWTLREDEPVDHAMIKRRVQAALARRADAIAKLGAEELVELIKGEPDGLPGLVVDYYGGKDGYLLCGFQSGAAEAWKVPIVQALIAETGCPNVFQRADEELRKGEGLPVFTRELAGAAPPAKSVVKKRGVRVYMDLKTGFEFPKGPV